MAVDSPVRISQCRGVLIMPFVAGICGRGWSTCARTSLGPTQMRFVKLRHRQTMEALEEPLVQQHKKIPFLPWLFLQVLNVQLLERQNLLQDQVMPLFPLGGCVPSKSSRESAFLYPGPSLREPGPAAPLRRSGRDADQPQVPSVTGRPLGGRVRAQIHWPPLVSSFRFFVLLFLFS